jgi:hypothetical protein
VLKDIVLKRVGSPLLRESANRILDDLRLPAELLAGDGVVTVRSASLKNACKITRMTLDHLGIKQDEKVIRQIVDVLTGQ